MRSLAAKLTLAFLAVALLAVALVALLGSQGAEGRLSSYLSQGPTIVRVEAALRAVEDYYSQKGSWEGVNLFLSELSKGLGAHLVITDNNGRVLGDSAQELTNKTLSSGALGMGLSILGGGTKEVGVLYYLPLEGGTQNFWWDMMASMMANTPDSGPQHMGGMMGPMGAQERGREPLPPQAAQILGPTERDYLRSIRSSLIIGGLVAGAGAVGLSLILARQLAQPLRNMAQASRAIAQGDLSQRVAVGSKDELGELASAFNGMAEALERNEKLRRQIVADIAHELRTPLSVIQGKLEAMMDGVVPLTEEQVASVHEESLLLVRLVSDLRELSLAEAGQLHLQISPVDVGELIRKSVEKMGPQTKEKAFSLEISLSPNLPLALADPDRLEQILGNLLSNALRYTPEGGRIVVEAGTYRDGNRHSLPQIRVSVSDTGKGIPPEDLPHVFDRFFRADRSRSRATGGSGIGLAIVKELVEAHGGKVWAESIPGQGSTFYFTVPASPETHFSTVSYSKQAF